MITTKQLFWSEDGGWQSLPGSDFNNRASLVLVFGERYLLENATRYEELKMLFPAASIVLSSTSGDILNTQVYDNTITATAISFQKTAISCVSLPIMESSQSREVGKSILNALHKDDLVHVLVIADGGKVNGSELVKGLNSSGSVSVTGGLAGDASRFEKTLTGLNQAPTEGNVIGIGFYGSNIKVGHGTYGGWDLFGAEREVTKSVGNVLYDLDGRSALDLYKLYLGEKAKDLPASALLFPLGMRFNEDSEVLVRTILSVDHELKTMTFAGDIPQGSIVRLMKANFEKLIDGAENAANASFDFLEYNQAQFALLISCVGRKLVLGPRIEEEVEAVREALGKKPTLAGFYSYGEISPLAKDRSCELHNQTMTVTTFAEVL